MINVGKEKYEVDNMDGYTDWRDAEKDIRIGTEVRLLLGNDRVIDGKWNGKQMIVTGVTRNLGSRVREGDLIAYNERTFGFLRHRQNYRDITILTRSWILLHGAEGTIDEIGEEE